MGSKVVWAMLGTRNDLIRALHNSWLNITVPYLHNLYNSLPRRIRVVNRGRDYPTKDWLTKYFRKKNNIRTCVTFPERNILFAANYRDERTFLIFDVRQRLIWYFPAVASFCQGIVHIIIRSWTFWVMWPLLMLSYLNIIIVLIYRLMAQTMFACSNSSRNYESLAVV